MTKSAIDLTPWESQNFSSNISEIWLFWFLNKYWPNFAQDMVKFLFFCLNISLDCWTKFPIGPKYRCLTKNQYLIFKILLKNESFCQKYQFLVNLRKCFFPNWKYWAITVCKRNSVWLALAFILMGIPGNKICDFVDGIMLL